MRRIAALAALSALVLAAGCSSSNSSSSSGKSTTTVPSALAKWLDTLSPPLRSFAEAQTAFAAAQQGGDLKIIKESAQGVAQAAVALSAAMKQSSGAPQDSAADIQQVEATLDGLAPLAVKLTSCADTNSCKEPLAQFTDTFTDGSNATNDLVVKARPPATTPTTRKTASATSTSTTSGFDVGRTTTTARSGGATGSTASTAPTTTKTAKSPAFTTWIKSYGNDLVETAKAQGTLAATLSSSDPSVAESACAAYVSRVNATDSNPAPPDVTAASALNNAMTYTRASYAVCRDDPSVRSSEGEDAIRNDFYSMGQAMPAYFQAIS